MDWTDLSNRLADGAKVYKAFQDGVQAASMLGNLERARNELQAQYDALPGQITSAKEDLRMIQAAGDSARVEAARAAEVQRQTVEAAHAKRMADLQAEADAWGPKLVDLKKQFQVTFDAQQAALIVLERKIQVAQQQVTELNAIKDSLKSQLERVS